MAFVCLGMIFCAECFAMGCLATNGCLLSFLLSQGLVWGLSFSFIGQEVFSGFGVLNLLVMFFGWLHSHVGICLVAVGSCSSGLLLVLLNLF